MGLRRYTKVCGVFVYLLLLFQKSDNSNNYKAKRE